MACKCILPRIYEVGVPRKWWMRLVPGSSLCFCTHCQQTTFYFLDGLRRRRPARSH
ncbi:hypothetical protein [Ramlibacter agri]|uniref:hypothetical protein n=1 Tax=Ramlibacter agri TaxID=2728837 RepID=UPI00146DFF68|nr:hypothetical protein [Ramlibacter agri]